LFKLAVLSGSESAIDIHVRRGDDVNARDGEGRSLLMLAAAKGNINVCRILLDAGANIALADAKGNDAFSFAVNSRHREVELLLRSRIAETGTFSQQPPADPQEKMVVDDPTLPIDGWEEEDAVITPPSDYSVCIEAKNRQSTLSQYVPVDMAEDWSEVDVVLPVIPNGRFWETLSQEVRSEIRQIILNGIEDGAVSGARINILLSETEKNELDPDFANRLFLALSDLNIRVNDFLPDWRIFGTAQSEDGDPDESVAILNDAFDFLEDLASPAHDPLYLYAGDTSRHPLLTREDEVDLGQKLAEGLSHTIRGIAESEAAVGAFLAAVDVLEANQTKAMISTVVEGRETSETEDSTESTVSSAEDDSDVLDEPDAEPEKQEFQNHVENIRQIYTLARTHRPAFTTQQSSFTQQSVADALYDELQNLRLPWEFLTHLVDRAVPNPRMLVGAMIYDARPPHNLWYAGGKFSWWTGQIPHRASVDDGPLYWLTGMGTLIPVGAFAEIGMYDEKHFPQYVGDVDFTLRAAKHGYALSIAERSRIYNRTEESIQRLIRQHVTLRNFFVPLFSNKSDSKIGMRLTLYRRYWPTLLAPIAFCAYYAVFFAKQTTRLLRGLR